MEEPLGNGCSAHNDCFTCPFSVCRYEMDPGQLRREIKQVEMRVIAAQVGLLVSTGIGRQEAVEQVAQGLGYTPRTVYRHLSRVA